MILKSSNHQFITQCLILWLTLSCFSNSEKDRNSEKDKVFLKKNYSKTDPYSFRPIPVLCYHAIKETQKNDTPDQKAYSVSPSNFSAQIKALADKGYKTITPDQLKTLWTTNQALPDKPILITFDDGRKEQFSIAAEILEKYNFKGVFFIMTVTIGKEHYMNQSEIKELSDRGHIIGCHTWDHHKVTDYKKDDWKLQLAKPKKTLEKITGKPVTSFAYPYGIWNPAAADSLKNNGFSTAFIIFGKQNNTFPLYTIPRIVVKNSSSIPDFVEKN